MVAPQLTLAAFCPGCVHSTNGKKGGRILQNTRYGIWRTESGLGDGVPGTLTYSPHNGTHDELIIFRCIQTYQVEEIMGDFFPEKMSLRAALPPTLGAIISAQTALF